MDSGTWSVIGTNFDPDDETANFGTRRALEAEGKLFDVFTYATIDPKVWFAPCQTHFLEINLISSIVEDCYQYRSACQLLK